MKSRVTALGWWGREVSSKKVKGLMDMDNTMMTVEGDKGNKW